MHTILTGEANPSKLPSFDWPISCAIREHMRPTSTPTTNESAMPIFVFGALVVAARILIAARPEVAKAIKHQSEVDSIRDLFVRVDELVERPDGPRIGAETPTVPSRLHKL